MPATSAEPDVREMDADETRPADEEREPHRGGLVIVGVAVAGMVGMWVYVLYLAFFVGRQPPVDRLDDPAFARAAEARCADAVAEVDELLPASESPSAAARAEVLDEANATFAVMLDDLDELASLAPEGSQRDTVDEWLADWRTYLGDRQAFADALRQDPDSRLLVSEKPGTGRHITLWIDEFANANRMESCVSPGDA